MSRSFNVAALNSLLGGADWREPKMILRAFVVGMALLNVGAAAFAFHLFGTSPEQAQQQLESARATARLKRDNLIRTRQIAGKVVLGRSEGDQFLVTYMTPRRTTYSTILQELQESGKDAGMTLKEATIAPLDPIKGSTDLSMMTITSSFEGTYPNLLKFINLLDRSKRFLIIESLAAAPQASSQKLNATLKVNTFVRQDTEDSL